MGGPFVRKVGGPKLFVDPVLKIVGGQLTRLTRRLRGLCINCTPSQIIFQDGVLPTAYESALVTPQLRKPDPDRDIPANFRPISNLHTISKIL